MEIIPKEKRIAFYSFITTGLLMGATLFKMNVDYGMGKDNFFSRTWIWSQNYILKDEYKLNTEDKIQKTLRENKQKYEISLEQITQ